MKWSNAAVFDEDRGRGGVRLGPDAARIAGASGFRPKVAIDFVGRDGQGRLYSRPKGQEDEIGMDAQDTHPHERQGPQMLDRPGREVGRTDRTSRSEARAEMPSDLRPALRKWAIRSPDMPLRLAARLLIAGVLWMAVACGESKDLPNLENTAPEIVSVVAERATVGQGEAIDITCTAEDAQLDRISYIWSTDVGEFFGSVTEAEISWRAPEDYEGEAVITVVATDGKDDSPPGSATILVVGERGTLGGVVSRSGTGELLEGAIVTVEGLSAETGATGAYSIDGVPLGNQTVEASLDGFDISTRVFEIKAGPNTLNFVLTHTEDTGVVVGTVTNSQGAPVANATCRIVGRSLETQTDASGNYSLGPIPRDSFTLQVSRSGYINFSGTRQLESEELRVDVVLTTDVPGQPANVVAARSGLTMTLSWDAPPSETIDGYQVYWKIDTDGTVALPSGRLEADQRQIVVTGETDRRYRFLVAAINFDGVEGSDLGVSNDLVLTTLSPRVSIPEGFVVVGDAVPGQTGERAVPHPANPIPVPAFRIDETEVTNQQFFAFLWEASSTGFIDVDGTTVRESGRSLIHFNASKVKLDGNAFTLTPEFRYHPVTGVTWYGADAYARFYGRRLPTELEWERAARGASEASGLYPESAVGYGTRYPWGNQAPTVALANFGDHIGTTRPVRSLPGGATVHWTSPVYELSGNVWEWCEDWYGGYQSPHAPPGTGTLKVLRGGSFYEDATWLSAWARSFGDPTIGSPRIGFRCASDGDGRPRE